MYLERILATKIRENIKNSWYYRIKPKISQLDNVKIIEL